MPCYGLLFSFPVKRQAPAETSRMLDAAVNKRLRGLCCPSGFLTATLQVTTAFAVPSPTLRMGAVHHSYVTTQGGWATYQPPMGVPGFPNQPTELTAPRSTTRAGATESAASPSLLEGTTWALTTGLFGNESLAQLAANTVPHSCGAPGKTTRITPFSAAFTRFAGRPVRSLLRQLAVFGWFFRHNEANLSVECLAVTKKVGVDGSINKFL